MTRRTGNNVKCPAGLAAQVADCTLGAIAFPFTGDIPVNTDYYEYKALKEIGVPFLDTSRNVFTMAPSFNWGTTRRISAARRPTRRSRVHEHQPDAGLQHQHDAGHGQAHRKAGFYVNHSYKAQNSGAGGNGAPSFQGALSFGVDTNNPLDSGFPYANAALGVFSSYGQQSAFIEGSFLYNNVEWFLQDNWKVNRKLTLDYGVRFVHQTPQYDQFNQVSTFRPETWKLASAPYLYVPGCVGNTATCTGTNRVAMDPRTGALLGRRLVVAGRQRHSGIGRRRQRPDTGRSWHRQDRLYVAVARRGAALRLRVRRDRQAEDRVPRVGRLVLRPAGRQLGVQHRRQPAGRDQHASRSGASCRRCRTRQFKFGPVPIVTSFQYNSSLPKDIQWNGGMQIALPWSSAHRYRVRRPSRLGHRSARRRRELDEHQHDRSRHLPARRHEDGRRFGGQRQRRRHDVGDLRDAEQQPRARVSAATATSTSTWADTIGRSTPSRRRTTAASATACRSA